jgi:WD40 repeat protein
MTNIHHFIDADIHNRNSLEDLVWSIESSQGEFSLTFAHSNYKILRRQMEKKLQQISGITITPLRLKEEDKNLFTKIQKYINVSNKQPSALMVSGLESVKNIEQLLQSTNQVREEFRKHFRFPLILWINDEILDKLNKLAPDFKHWSPSPIYFKINPHILVKKLRKNENSLFQEIIKSSQESFLLNTYIFNNDYFYEFNAAIKELKHIGQDLEPDILATQEFIIGREYYGQGKFNDNEVLAHYQKSQDFLKEVMNLEAQVVKLREAVLLFHIGLYNCRLAEKGISSNWEKARNNFDECIKIFENINRQDLVAKYINFLCKVLEHLEDWDELEKIAKISQDLHGYDNTVELAQAFGFLAHVAVGKSQWERAIEFANQALNIINISTSEQKKYQDIYYLLLAQAQEKIGQHSESIKTQLKAIEIQENSVNYNLTLDHVNLFIKLLEYLRELYFLNKHYLDAYQIKIEKQSIEQQYGLTAFVGASRLKKSKFGEYFNRQDELDNLIERVVDIKNKITVIYGQSGVGKSSILEAGLVPALKNKISSNNRNFLPIIIRTYDNWLENLGQHLIESLKATENISELVDELVTRNYSEEAIYKQLTQNDKSKNIRLVTIIIFDQFEEFLLTQPRTKINCFFQFLSKCLENNNYVKIILSLRDDYLHILLKYSSQVKINAINNDILQENIRFELKNFSRKEVNKIICNQTKSSNFSIGETLINKLVEDLVHEDEDEIRPIELQIVGSQLEKEKIQTLDKYQSLSNKPKNQLVNKYIEEVIKCCGEENAKIAEIVLSLFIDKKSNTRILKTHEEIKKEFELLGERKLEALNLVLEILKLSGLVLQIPETSNLRYQLVHDYLVDVIRQREGSNILEEIKKQRERAKKAEAKANQFLRLFLAGSIAGLLLFVYLFLQTKIEQIRAMYLYSQLILLTNSQQFDGLLGSFKASKELNTIPGRLAFFMFANDDNTSKYESVFQDAIYKVFEYNRLEKHTSDVKDVSFSPDGKMIATASADFTVKLWGVDGREITTLQGHKGVVNSVIFSSDSQTIATASWDGTIKLWDLDGNILQSIEKNGSSFERVSFSPDGQTIASASWDGTNGNVIIWDRQGKEIQTLRGHSQVVVNSVNFSPNGQLIATADNDGTVILWSRQGAKLRTFKVHNSKDSGEPGIWSVNFSPDGQTIVTGSKDKKIKLWSLNGIKLKTIGYHDDAVTSINFSPDGQKIASASSDRTVKVWSLEGKELQTLRGHKDWVWSVNFSPDGQTLASASKDKTVKLWKIEGKNLQVIPAHDNAIYNSNFSPDGQLIATASADKTVKIWNRDGKELQTLKGYDSEVTDVSFSPDGNIIATSTGNKIVKLWTRDGKELQTINNAHEGWIWSIRFSPDGQTIATASAGGNDHTVKLWNWNSIEKKFDIVKTLKGHRDRVNSVVFSPDGQTIATASWDKTIILWSRDGQNLKTLEGHQDGVHSVSFSPDGKTLASSSEDGSLILWSIKGEKLQTLKGHNAGVFRVRFSPDGQKIATASLDKTVKLWTKDGKELKTFTGHDDLVFSLSFSPDNKTLASSDKAGKLILWNVDFTTDDLQRIGCDWVRDYMKNNPNADHNLCDGIY